MRIEVRKDYEEASRLGLNYKLFPRFFVAEFIIQSVLVLRDFFGGAFISALRERAFIVDQIGVFAFAAHPKNARFDLQRFLFLFFHTLSYLFNL